MDHADGFGVARAARTLRTLANGGQSLSALAQRGSLGSHPAGLATTSGAHPFICLSLGSVAVVLEATGETAGLAKAVTGTSAAIAPENGPLPSWARAEPEKATHHAGGTEPTGGMSESVLRIAPASSSKAHEGAQTTHHPEKHTRFVWDAEKIQQLEQTYALVSSGNVCAAA